MKIYNSNTPQPEVSSFYCGRSAGGGPIFRTSVYFLVMILSVKKVTIQ